MSMKAIRDDLIAEITSAFPPEVEKPEGAVCKNFDTTICDPFEAAQKNFFGPWNLLPREVLIHPPDVIHYLDHNQILKYLPAFLIAEIHEDAECLGLGLDSVLLSSGSDSLSQQRKWVLNRLNENQLLSIKKFLLYYAKCGWISEDEALSWKGQ